MRFAVIASLLLAAPSSAKETARQAEDAAIAADNAARRIRAEANLADSRAARLRQQKLALGVTVRAAEAQLQGLELRVGQLAAARRLELREIARRQGEITRLLAAMQMLARRPAGLVLLQPQDLATTARVSAALAAIRPQLALRTADLRARVERIDRANRRLKAAGAALGPAKADLADKLAGLDRLYRLQTAARDTLDARADVERKRAIAAANRAITLRQLVTGIERDDAAARRTVPAPTMTAGWVDRLAYHMPIAGRIQQRFGERDSNGVMTRGITLAGREGGLVTAPAGGRVAYAGPFREHGEITIIEHPGDAVTLISGMERVDVVVGEAVGAGSPIGRLSGARPVIYVELRLSGRIVDPGPFLAGKRVGNKG